MSEPRLDSLDGLNPNTVTITATGAVSGCKMQVFINDTQHGGDITPTITGGTASADVPLRPVGDAEENYKLTFKVVKGGGSVPGTPDFVVWPNPIDLTAVDDAGDPIGPVPFVLTVGGTNQDFPTNNQGKAERCYIGTAGQVTVSLKSGWDFVDPGELTTQKFRKRKFKVKRTKVAEFIKPTGSAPIDQLVNLPTSDEGRDGKGNTIKFEAGIKNGQGKANDEIFIQVKFGRESKRTTPKPELKDAEGITEENSGKLFKGKVKLASDGTTASFTVALGIAGADTCEVHIGTTAQCKDATRSIKNWREIEYETWQPKNDGPASGVLSTWTLGGSAGTPGMAAAAANHLKAKLQDVAVKPKLKQAKFFTRAELEAEAWVPASGGIKLVPSFKGDFFGEPAGDKVVVLTWSQINKLLGTLSPAAEKRLQQIVFADYVADSESWFQRFDNVPSAGRLLTPDKKLLPWSITAPDGRGLTALHWEAFVKTGTVWNQEDPGWRVLNDEADLKKHIEIRKVDEVRVRFPVDLSKPDYPGTYAQGKAPKQVKFNIYIEGRGWQWGNINGCAAGGVVAMNRYSADIGAVDPIGVTNVIIHEIGHNMGQVYANKPIDTTFGRPASGVIPGIPFPASGGNVYGGHGHTGTHCAFGLTATDKACADYGNFYGDCVMFGSDNMMSNAPREFCDECKDFIKAEDLSDVRKKWN